MIKNKEIIESQGITGSHGFIGGHLFNRCPSPVRLKRDGKVPKKVTRVFDLSGYGNKFDQTDAEEMYVANVDRVLTLLKNSIGKKSVVLTSTSSVLLPIQTSYSRSKYMMEELAKKWVKETKENVVIVRPSTVIGIGENPQHLIPKLIHSCMTGEEMDFVGEPTHDFIDVNDFVNGMIFISDLADKYKGHIFNISFGVSVPNEFVKDVVEDITKRRANIKRVKSLRPYDTTKWNVNNDKIRALGWRPTKLLWDTIKDMVEDYKLKNVQ